MQLTEHEQPIRPVQHTRGGQLQRPVRLLGAASLVATALLTLVSTLLQPEIGADPVASLAAIEDAGGAATVSITTFALSQLPFVVGCVVVALLCRGGAPRLAVAGGTLAVLGGFGHAVFGGIGLSQLAMAASPERAAMAEVVTAIESGPAVVFMAMGLLGTVLGLVLLGVALFRSRVVARWIPLTLWAFLVIEFVGTNLSAWASPAAGALYVAAFGGLAVELARHSGARTS